MTQSAGSYRFHSEITQTSTPLATARNAGRTPTVERLLVEGLAEPSSARMNFGVWKGRTSADGITPGLRVRVHDGVAATSQAGGEWQTSPGTAVVTSAGDTSLFLAAAKHVVPLGPQPAGGQRPEGYSFTIDGATLAAEIAHTTPGSATISGLAGYRSMSGTGQLWLDTSGRPAREVVTLTFAAAADQVVTADIITVFSDYTDAPARGMAWLHDARQATPLVLLVVCSGLLGWMLVPIALRRVRWRPAIAIGLVLTVFATTTVTNSPHAKAAPAGHAPGRATSKPTRGTAKPTNATGAVTAGNSAPAPGDADPEAWVRKALTGAAASQVSPHLDPLATVGPQTADPGTDTDGDGLSDVIEARLGTDPAEADSDGDHVPDGVEVRGFAVAGDTANPWFTDPLNPDTDGDQLPDGVEWGDDYSLPGVDTDGDSVPDVFDEDNDGDGVPDTMDLSPEGTVPGTFDQANPFLLRIDGLATDASTLFVDFQVRPTAASRLQVALNPLDWPTDNKGQIRDVNASSNDMQLIPMLEITVPDSAHTLPSADDLRPYGITQNEIDPATHSRVLYVPLSVMTDQATGAKVGFNGRMRYDAQSLWGAAHEVRVVWAVKVNNDVLTPVCPKPPAAQPAGCTTDGAYLLDQPQVVHRYYDEWNLTGISVTQERGSEVALVYQDPAAVADPTEQGATWMVPDLLSERFLARSPDNPAATRPELDVAGIVDALDHAHVGASADTAYGLPNVFSVQRSSYPTFDDAVNGASSADIPGVLHNAFGAAWTGDAALQPLIVTAYSTRRRTISFQQNSAYSVMAGATMTVDFHPAGNDDAPTDELAGFKWTQYCSPAGSEPAWQPCEAVDAWNTIHDRYDSTLLDPNDPLNGTVGSLTANERTGETLAMQLYWSAIASGITTPLQRDSGAVSQALTPFSDTSSADLSTQYERVRGTLGLGAVAAKKIANFKMMKAISADIAFRAAGEPGLAGQPGGVYAKLGEIINQPGLVKKVFGRGGFFDRHRGIALVTALATVAAGAFELAADAVSDKAQKLTLLSLSLAANLAMNVYSAVRSVRQIAAVAAPSVLRSLGLAANGVARSAGMVGLVISGLFAWGFAIASIAQSGAGFASPQFNQAIAGAIGATAFAVFTTALSLTGYGLILVGVVAVIDGILQIICEATGSDSLRNDSNGTCITVSGTVVEAMTRFVYSYELMIDVDETAKAENGDPPLVQTQSPDIALTDPSQGWAVGNSWTASMSVTTNIRHQSPSPWNWLIIAYLYYFSENNLRSASVAYSLTSPLPVAVSTSWDSMPSAWTNVSVYDEYLAKDLFKADTTTQVTLDPQLLTTAGINQSFDLHLNMAYAFPAYECWPLPTPPLGYPMIPICYKRESSGSSTNTFEPFVFDVLPATLDEFLALRSTGDGRSALAWDSAFGPLADADSDGLLAAAVGGLDPDDRTPDVDGDGLTDSLELEWQQAGAAVSPRLWDSDLDGLTDAQERLLRTDPGVADTDNDGLLDGEEVRHQHMVSTASGPVWDGTWTGGWAVAVEGQWSLDGVTTSRSLFVSSDPFLADGDSDGVSDEAERQLALTAKVDRNGEPYHPLVPNASPITVAVSTDDTDGYVVPGQHVQVSTTATAFEALQPGVVNVDAVGTPVSGWTPSTLDFDPSQFTGSDTRTDTRDFTVPVDATGGPVDLHADVREFLDLINPTGPSWQSNDETALTGDRQYGWADLAAAGADAVAQFVLADSSSSTAWGNGGGNVSATNLPSGAPTQLDQDTEPDWPNRLDTSYLQGANGADVACRDDGNCLTVWDSYDNCSTVTITAILVSTDHDNGSNGVEPAIVMKRSPDAFEPNDGGVLWYSGWTGNGGNGFTVGQRGPNAYGFPLSAEFCGDAGIALFESDRAVDGSGPFTQLQYTTGLSDAVAQEFPIHADTAFSGWVQFSNSAQRSSPLDCPTDTECQEIYLEITVTPDVGSRVLAASTAPEGNLGQSQFVLGDGQNPDVASNGTSFATTWMEDSSDPAVCSTVPCRLVQLDVIASPLPPVSSIVANLDAASVSDTQVVWDGSKYVVLVKMPTGGGIIAYDSTPSVVSLDAVQSRRTHTFAAVHDDTRNELVTVYEQSGGAIVGVVGYGAAPTIKRTLFSGDTAWSQPRIVANPFTGGWLVTAENNGRVFALSLDHDLLPIDPSDAAPLEVTSNLGGPAFDTALACPAASAVPAVDLSFDELPGAATAKDTSIAGNDGTFTTGSAPAFGYPGAPDATDSVFAAEFTGVDNVLTVPDPITGASTITFWYRSTARASGAPFTIAADAVGGERIEIDPSTGVLTYGTAASTVSTAPTSVDASLADGNWHFVAVTHQANGGALVIYIDGVTRTTASTFPSGAHATHLVVQGGAAPVRIDQLRIYTSALGSGRIAALFNRTDLPVCLAMTTVSGATATDLATYHWSRLQFTAADTRGGSVTASASLGLIVDAEAPTSAIAAPAAHVMSTGVVVGGTASDAESGIATVQVSLDGGSWLDATGAEAWSYALPGNLADGTHTLRSRAVDMVGNVEGTPQEIAFSIDGTAPAVTLDAPGVAAVRPVIDPASGRPHLSLSGTVGEGGSGIATDGVSVQLVAHGSPSDEAGWQVATVQPTSATNGNWSIEYEWPAQTAPSGSFDIRVAATDLAGNTSAHVAALGSVTLDSEAPTALLAATDTASKFFAVGSALHGSAADTYSGVATVEVALRRISDVTANPPVAPTWTPATLSARNATAVAWSRSLPVGVEGLMQVDLRVTDAAGNVTEVPGVWRGYIDTSAPRLTYTAAYTGKIAAGGTQREVAYHCSAADKFLSVSAFDCPGESVAVPQQVFAIDPLIQSLFPSQSMLAEMTVDYKVMKRSGSAWPTLRACDEFGNCATLTATPPVAPALVTSASPPRVVEATASTVHLGAALLSPFDGQFVRASSSAAMVVNAWSAAGLKRVTVKLNNVVVQQWDFPAEGAPTSFDDSVSLSTAIDDADNTVEVIAQDWLSGSAAADPTTFFYDATAPSVTSAVTDLTLANSWGVGTDMYVVSGAASDRGGITSVTVKVGDQPWTGVAFDGTSWGGAVHIPEADGTQLAILVRAYDRAGNATEITVRSNVDLAASLPAGFVRPSTAVGPLHPVVGSPDTVTIDLQGTAGTNPLAGFMCSLDGAAAAICAANFTLADLSTGEHTLSVAAIDTGGYVDLTPAIATWTIAAAGPQVALLDTPTRTTTQRDATFTFSVAAGSTAACSVDGATFVPCTSPYRVGSLELGDHRFAVRATAAGSSGTPRAFAWTVTDAELVATDMVVTVTGDDPIGKGITLLGTGSAALAHRVVDAPQHGLLSGTGADRVYTPFAGYYGPDSFTYEVDDGVRVSALATVNITVRMPSVAIYAEESASIGDDSVVSQGSVIVQAASPGTAKYSLWLGLRVRFPDPATRAAANTLSIGRGTTVPAAVTNTVTGTGKVAGTTSAFHSGDWPAMPAVPTVPLTGGRTGASNVNVVARSTMRLAPGTYGTLQVGDGATLVLSGGLYLFDDVAIGFAATVSVENPTELRVVGRLTMALWARLQPATMSSTFTSDDIVVTVLGADSGTMTNPIRTEAAVNTGATVELAAGCALHGYIVAPRGTIRLADDSINAGSLIARRVTVGSRAVLGPWAGWSLPTVS